MVYFQERGEGKGCWMVWPLKDALTGHTLACRRRLGGGMEGTDYGEPASQQI